MDSEADRRTAPRALGAIYAAGPFAGRPVGAINKIGRFSFNGNKILTTGGEGMIVTDDEALDRRARHLTIQAGLPRAEYRHDEVGFNARGLNLPCSVRLTSGQQERVIQALADRANRSGRPADRGSYGS